MVRITPVTFRNFISTLIVRIRHLAECIKTRKVEVRQTDRKCDSVQFEFQWRHSRNVYGTMESRKETNADVTDSLSVKFLTITRMRNYPPVGMQSVKKFVVHVLVKKCEHTHKWVAQGIESDIVAQADTLKLLEQRFMATARAYIQAYSDSENPLEAVGPAPKQYWTLFRKLEERARNSKIRPFPKRGKTTGEAVFLQAA